MSVLELKDVKYNYPGANKSVLNGVNASLEKGKIYSIVGKSGAGKTTILSLLSGLDTCTSGEISFNGQNIKDIDRDEFRAKSIGVIFQSYNLLLNATAMENIELAMDISKSSVKDKKVFIYELLSKIGIDRETADRTVLKLSGGEQQRVGIARALSHEPDVLIADEPTGNLDHDTEAEILQILVKLAHEDNKCVVVVTHSKRVSDYADEVLGLSNGVLTKVR